LIYRVRPRLAVLLVRETWGHDRGTWGIPKGRIESGERADEAARRELTEETGVAVRGELEDLGRVRRGLPRGSLHAYAAGLPRGAEPRPTYPEVDRAELVELVRACRIIHPEQRVLLDRLVRRMRIACPRSAAWLDAEVDLYLGGSGRRASG
jgi:predicted NUDIX family NTP pyrophosphohydrolase